MRSVIMSGFIFCALLVVGLQEASWISTAQAATTSEPRMRALRDGEKLEVDELRQLQLDGANFVLFDARGRGTYQEAHITGALLPLSDAYFDQHDLHKEGQAPDPNLAEWLTKGTQNYPKDTPIITYCNHNCTASTILLLYLKHLGFTNVKAMKPGFQTWQERGYPVEVGSKLLS